MFPMRFNVFPMSFHKFAGADGVGSPITCSAASDPGDAAPGTPSLDDGDGVSERHLFGSDSDNDKIFELLDAAPADYPVDEAVDPAVDESVEDIYIYQWIYQWIYTWIYIN